MKSILLKAAAILAATNAQQPEFNFSANTGGVGRMPTPGKRQVIARKHRHNAKAKIVARQKIARKNKNRRR